MIVERLNRAEGATVDIDYVKGHTRVDGDDDNAALQRMADAAALEAEDLAQIALLSQTVRVTLDGWPRGHSFRLPIGPLLDWSTVEVTADGEAFEGFSVMTGQRPQVRLSGPRPCGQIVIEYVAGYGEAPQDIPEDLVLAIMDQAAAYYDARGPGDPKRQAQSPHFARIIGRYRGVRI